MESDQTYDFIIVGSGGGSVPAALVMKSRGLEPLIVEKQAKIGGTSAFSGGVIWIPNNHLLNDEGGGDSHARSREYLDGLIGDVGPASTPARRDAFIRYGAEMVEFLEGEGMQFVHAHWPDYYDNRPGGIADGRSITAPMFNVKELGQWADRLGYHEVTGTMPVMGPEARHMFMIARTWAGKRMAATLALRLVRNKLLGRTQRACGNALQGRLFQIALRRQVPIWTETPVTGFLVENGRVTGVKARRHGEEIAIRARRGVLINAGGFSRNLAMREKYQPKPTSVDWTLVNPGDTGEMIEAAMALGARVDLMDESWWMASSYLPDGSLMGMHSPNDIGRPHVIVVNSKGERFANESNSYMEFGQRMYAADAVPAWAVMDSRNRKYYTWANCLPGVTPRALLENGYFLKADRLEDLAAKCGIDPTGLARTIERFNGFARKGVDEDFQRGESAYNRYYGDPTHAPNPNLGTLERPPFYAVKILPGDVGTAGGVITDEHARVLDSAGMPIPGLYATGNSSAPVVGRSYPGAGASVGPSMTFGYIAALHAAGANS
jgi:3-oxosteroid 1-dehydrogenase